MVGFAISLRKVGLQTRVFLILMTLQVSAPFQDGAVFTDVHDLFQSEDNPVKPQAETSSGHPVYPICESFAVAFAEAAAAYTECFIANARPMHLCTKCVEKYLEVKHSYYQLDAVSISLYSRLYNNMI